MGMSFLLALSLLQISNSAAGGNYSKATTDTNAKAIGNSSFPTNIMNSKTVGNCVISDQPSCAKHNTTMCKDTIAAILSESECSKQAKTHPCHLVSKSSHLFVVTSIDAVLGILIVSLSALIGVRDLFYCLKATSCCFYWSVLSLIIVDILVTVFAFALTETIDAQGETLEHADCLNNMGNKFASFASVRSKMDALRYIEILKIAMSGIFAIPFIVEIVSMTLELSRHLCCSKSNDDEKSFCVFCAIFFKRDTPDDDENDHPGCCSKNCNDRWDIKDSIAKIANWLFGLLGAVIGIYEMFWAREMLVEVHTIFSDVQNTQETSWCLHCDSGISNERILESEYEASLSVDDSMRILIALVACVFFVGHCVCSLLLGCRGKKIRAKLEKKVIELRRQNECHDPEDPVDESPPLPPHPQFIRSNSFEPVSPSSDDDDERISVTA